MEGKRLVSSTVISEMQEAWNWLLSQLCCSVVTMPIKLRSYVTWSRSETVASIQLCTTELYFSLRKYLVTWFCDVNAAALSLSSLMKGECPTPSSPKMIIITVDHNSVMHVCKLMKRKWTNRMQKNMFLVQVCHHEFSWRHSFPFLTWWRGTHHPNI